MKNKKLAKNQPGKLKQKTVTLTLGNAKPSRHPLSEAVKAIQQLLAQKRGNEAISILEQLCKQMRKNKAPHLELLGVYIIYRQLDKADALAQLLLKRFPGDSDALVRVASFYHTVNEPELALATLKKARTLNPKNNDAYQLSATIYQGIGEDLKAAECLDHILSREPNNAYAISAKASALKAKATEEFRELALGLAESAQAGSREQSQLYFALAWLYEPINKDKHFDYLNTANALTRPSRPWDGNIEKLRWEINQKAFSKTTFSALSRYGDGTFRPVFIAAMPRSGTTLLEQMLGAHSSTKCVGENAPFDIALNRAFLKGNPLAQRLTKDSEDSLEDISGIDRALAGIVDEYKSAYLVSDANDKRVVDKSLVNSAMAGIIRLAFPNARIIHLQRHPLDIIYSCYQQNFEAGSNYIYDLKSAAKAYKLYASNMALWKTLFPENIHTIRYEDLVEAPESTLRPLLEFCDLPWEDRCLNYRSTMDTINTASADQVRMPLYTQSIAKWKQVKSQLAPAMDELDGYLDY